MGCSVGIWMPHCTGQEDQGWAPGANAAPCSAQAAQVRWPTCRRHHDKEWQERYNKRGTKATLLPLDPHQLGQLSQGPQGHTLLGHGQQRTGSEVAPWSWAQQTDNRTAEARRKPAWPQGFCYGR